jgi:predicted HAD superfamily hydrolase
LKYFFEINQNIELLSIDIFDTLLFRLVDHPHQIFDEIGKKAIKSNLLHNSITVKEFALLRNIAAQDARKFQLERNGHAEVTLEQIYEYLPRFIGDKTELQLLEVFTESEFCYINPEIYKLIVDTNRQGTPVILTSDMYLSKAQLKQILKFNGFDLNLIKEIYVSCEHKGNKCSGVLFKKLLSDFPNIYPEEILHIGDNFDADFDSPKTVGIKSIYYPVIPDVMFEICNYECIFNSGCKYLTSLRKLSVHNSRIFKSIENQIGAGILGPVSTIFCDWILDICEEEDLKCVFPLMREAELLGPMLKIASSRRKLDIKVAPLSVSRESTWLPSLKSWNREACEDLCSRHGILVLDIFNIIDTELIAQFIPFQNFYFKDLTSEEQSKILNFLTSEKITQKCNKKIRKSYESLASYLDYTFDGNTNFITVDLGFNGTICNNLEGVFSKSPNNYTVTHLLAFGSDNLTDLKKKNIDIRSFFTSPGKNQDLLKPIQRSSFPIEQLFITGEIGSVVDYKLSSDQINPITQKVESSEEDIRSKKNTHASILNFQNLWYDLYAQKKAILRKPIECRVERRKICSSMTRVIEIPTPQEAEFLGNLSHDFNYGSTKTRLICSKKDTKTLGEIGSEIQFLKSSRIRGVHWPQGVITRSNPFFLLKQKLQYVTSDSYLQTMNDVIESAQIDKFSKIIVYGAGELGKAAVKAAKINSLTVECFVDRKKSLWGTDIEGTLVYSLATALDKYPEVPLLIGSFEFLDQIESTIKDMLAKKHLTNRIFSTKDLCL